jgi:hypothetical protein
MKSKLLKASILLTGVMSTACFALNLTINPVGKHKEVTLCALTKASLFTILRGGSVSGNTLEPSTSRPGSAAPSPQNSPLALGRAASSGKLKELVFIDKLSQQCLMRQTLNASEVPYTIALDIPAASLLVVLESIKSGDPITTIWTNNKDIVAHMDVKSSELIVDSGAETTYIPIQPIKQGSP